MAGSDSRRTAGLKTQAHELVKQYLEYDISNRVTAIYTTHTDAVHGTPCTKVTYEYVDAVSSLVMKMKEDNATWDASWDI